MYHPERALFAGIASVVTVTILITIKTAAFLTSGSASVLASLIDSITDAAVSVMSLLAIKISLLPADKNHRYGHGKVEGLAAVLQAAFIAAAAFFLALESLRRLADGHAVQEPGIGIIVMVISTLLSFVLVYIQNRTLAHAPSLAVEADRAHYASDIWMNGGVIVMLGAQMLGAPAWIDPIFALLVSLWLLRTVVQVGKKGIDMLLDRELSKDQREKIRSIILSDARVHGMHDLRTRASGMRIHITFDIEVDDTLTLKQAHDIAVDVENLLLAEFQNAEIMIHIDPLGDIHDARHEIVGVHH